MSVCPIQKAGNVETAFTIVALERLVITHALIFIDDKTGAIVKAEALALRFLGGDAYNALHAGIITCTRVADNLNVLDVAGLQTLQLHLVLHLTTIDINYWCSSAEHFYISVFSRHAGDA